MSHTTQRNALMFTWLFSNIYMGRYIRHSELQNNSEQRTWCETMEISISNWFYPLPNLLLFAKPDTITLEKTAVLVTGKTIFELNSFWLESKRTVFGVSLALVVHVQLPKLWCPLLMNSVLTGCVIWCVGPELQPGLDGNSSEGYSRVFIKKQWCSSSAGPV